MLNFYRVTYQFISAVKQAGHFEILVHYRGEIKRRLCRATTQNKTRLEPGTALIADGEERNIGTVVNSAATDTGQELLIVLERPYIESGRVVAEDAPDCPLQVHCDFKP